MEILSESAPMHTIEYDLATSHSDSNSDEHKVFEEEPSDSHNDNLINDEEERRSFTREIHRFMADIGKPLTKIPIMGYKELDLYQLFKEVVSYGGFSEVVKNVGTWSKIWKRLSNFDASITDSSFRLKKNYERYLLEFEMHRFPDHRKAIQDYHDRSALKRSHSNLGQQPHSPVNVAPCETTSSPSVSLPPQSPKKSGKKSIRSEDIDYLPSSRKRKNASNEPSDEEKMKIKRNEDMMDVSSGDETDAESAVAILHALKFCTMH